MWLVRYAVPRAALRRAVSRYRSAGLSRRFAVRFVPVARAGGDRGERRGDSTRGRRRRLRHARRRGATSAPISTPSPPSARPFRRWRCWPSRCRRSAMASGRPSSRWRSTGYCRSSPTPSPGSRRCRPVAREAARGMGLSPATNPAPGRIAAGAAGDSRRGAHFGHYQYRHRGARLDRRRRHARHADHRRAGGRQARLRHPGRRRGRADGDRDGPWRSSGYKSAPRVICSPQTPGGPRPRALASRHSARGRSRGRSGFKPGSRLVDNRLIDQRAQLAADRVGR